MGKNKFKKILKTLIVILILFIIIYTYNFENKKTHIVSNPKFSKKEQLEFKIEELEENNYKLKDELHDVNSQLEDLQRKYEYAEDLISILQDQLREYGIEPYEL